MPHFSQVMLNLWLTVYVHYIPFLDGNLTSPVILVLSVL